MTKTKEQLIIENDELHSRLAETQKRFQQFKEVMWMRLWCLVRKENKSIQSALLKHHIVLS